MNGLPSSKNRDAFFNKKHDNSKQDDDRKKTRQDYPALYDSFTETTPSPKAVQTFGDGCIAFVTVNHYAFPTSEVRNLILLLVSALLLKGSNL